MSIVSYFPSLVNLLMLIWLNFLLSIPNTHPTWFLKPYIVFLNTASLFNLCFPDLRFFFNDIMANPIVSSFTSFLIYSAPYTLSANTYSGSYFFNALIAANTNCVSCLAPFKACECLY